MDRLRDPLAGAAMPIDLWTGSGAWPSISIAVQRRLHIV